MKFISIVIRCDDVKKKDVLSFCIQATQSKLHLRKHLPERGLKGFKKGKGSIINIYLDLDLFILIFLNQLPVVFYNFLYLVY